MGSDMPDYCFARCDGHHEMVDWRITNQLAVKHDASFERRTRQEVRTQPIKITRDPLSASLLLLTPLSPPMVPPRTSRPKIPLAAEEIVVAWMAIAAIGAMAMGAA